MKKYLSLSFIFAIYGLVAGVLYRELTKFFGFSGRTMLGMAHPHILMLGLGGFLIVAVLIKLLNIQKKLTLADIFYTAGLSVASVMMIVRGCMEVAGANITASYSGMISGIAGLGHMAVAVGMVLYLAAFVKAAK